MSSADIPRLPPPLTGQGRCVRRHAHPDMFKAAMRLVIKLRRWVLSALLAVFLLVSNAVPSSAQEVEPGDGCTPSEQGRFRHSGGPANAGEGYLMTCNGSVWVKVFGLAGDGIFRPQFVNMPNCDDGDIIVYHAASGGLACSNP